MGPVEESSPLSRKYRLRAACSCVLSSTSSAVMKADFFSLSSSAFISSITPVMAIATAPTNIDSTTSVAMTTKRWKKT